LAADVYSRNSAIGDFKTKVQQLVVAKQRCVSVDGPLHAVGSRLNRFLDAVRKPDGVDMRVRGPPVCPIYLEPFGGPVCRTAPFCHA
jgi:hypothetical protein